MNLQEEITARGLLKQATDDALFDLYDKGGQTLYYGMDPTADSIHLWNFVWFMHALQYMKRGNKFIIIVGGATGMIWDPWGKNAEREFLDEKTLANNVAKIDEQVEKILKNITDISGVSYEYEVINNADFYKGMSYLDFLRKAWKYITVNNMMNKETVKKRLETADQSISYTEFSYMLIQGYDFVRLHDDHGCKLQIAGSDQRGNVVTGIELIGKISEKENKDAYGATTPLILDSTGKKFGKSEWNALRLSPEKNSPYTVYNYFMNVTDEDVERYLKIFSVKTLEELTQIVNQHNEAPESRYGQTQLAYLVTQIIFWSTSADECNLIRNTLYGEWNPVDAITKLDDKQCAALNAWTWWVTWAWWRLIELLVSTWLYESNGEAKKALKNNAISLNESKITDIWYEISDDDWINAKILLLRKGKKTYKTVLKKV